MLLELVEFEAIRACDEDQEEQARFVERDVKDASSLRPRAARGKQECAQMATGWEMWRLVIGLPKMVGCASGEYLRARGSNYGLSLTGEFSRGGGYSDEGVIHKGGGEGQG